MSFFERISRRADLMGEMISQKKVQIPVTDSGGMDMELRSAIYNCLSCKSEDECRAHLSTEGNSGQIPSFCPNAKIFMNWQSKFEREL